MYVVSLVWPRMDQLHRNVITITISCHVDTHVLTTLISGDLPFTISCHVDAHILTTLRSGDLPSIPIIHTWLHQMYSMFERCVFDM